MWSVRGAPCIQLYLWLYIVYFIWYFCVLVVIFVFVILYRKSNLTKTFFNFSYLYIMVGPWRWAGCFECTRLINDLSEVLDCFSLKLLKYNLIQEYVVSVWYDLKAIQEHDINESHRTVSVFMQTINNACHFFLIKNQNDSCFNFRIHLEY